MDKQMLKAHQIVYDWAKNGERPGGEFLWFAADRVGRVAVFITAGGGEVPDSVFGPSREEFLAFIAYLEGLGTPLHACGFGPFEERRMITYDYGTWLEVVYKRVVLPSVPLTVGEIPQDHRRIVECVQFDGSFVEAEMIYAGDLWKCR